ncbi:MAG TPA: type II toxin-antitoxin system RelE/ParE family toxin [Solirubrobacteraceae bacterium]
MTNLQAVYYRDADGQEPVLDYIGALDGRRRAALVHQLARLNGLTDAHPHLPFPYSSQVEGELRELRCHVGSELYRVLYRRSGRLVVLLHIFRKSTGKIQLADINTAQQRWEDFKARMDATPRKPPRAAGHDAP